MLEVGRVAQLFQSIGGALWGTLGLTCCVLLCRRWSGDFSGSVPGPVLLVWTLASIAWGGVAVSLYRCLTPRPAAAQDGSRSPWPVAKLRERAWAHWPEALSAGLSLLAIVAAAPRPTPWMVGVTVGLALLGGLCWYGISSLDRILATSEIFLDRVASPPIPATAPVTSIVVESPSETLAPVVVLHSEAGDDEATEADPLTRQTMMRRVDGDLDLVEGVCRVEFAPRQREASLHLAFCPPMAGTPAIDMEDLDANGWELKVAAVYPFGARISIRRPPDAASEGRVAYCASAALRHAG